MTLPNILTLFRLVLIPFFVVCFYLPYSWAYFAAALIFSVAAITDWLDGYLARRLQQSTPFGAFLDPVADKVMVSAALIMIVENYATVWVTIPAIFMIGREITISALREWMAELGKRGNVAVSWIGKWKTTAQMTALIAMLWQAPVGPQWLGYYPMQWLGLVALMIATVLTAWSMVAYLWAARGDLHMGQPENS